ncbi:MAG: S8 family peptidase [Solirubrobacteraceae bacterium]
MRRLPLTLGIVLALSCSALPPLARAAAGPASAPSTGNVLVLLSRGAVAATARSSVRAVVARLGARPAGRSVPEIGLITVRPPAGVTAIALAAALGRLPGVASATPEHRYVPRLTPNDPALSAFDPSSGAGQWTLERENFPSAWNLSRGDGALVGMIDTGVDATHPDLASKIAVAVNQGAGGTASTDESGHGTHVASLACADTNNQLGMAGAGYNCRLVVEKSDFSDSSVAAAIVDAANRHVGALNMSFGPSTPTADPAPQSEVLALRYAAAHNVVLVAAAADSPGTEQGDPANVVQPAGTGPDLAQGLGLDVTAADYSGHRASFAGSGSEISLAAFGAFQPDATGGLLGVGGPVPGIFGAFPAGQTDLEALPAPCQCRTTFGGSNRYAYLQGTSMAAPQVSATAAMMRVLNPFATVSDVITTLKRTASRPAGTGWTSDLGWGILNAGAALDAVRRIDRLAPVSKLSAPHLARRRVFVLRWSGHDQRPPELIASGIARYDIYARAAGGRTHRIASTTRHSLPFRGRAGVRYLFFAVAVDRAGNRESRPVNAMTRVARGAR